NFPQSRVSSQCKSTQRRLKQTKKDMQMSEHGFFNTVTGHYWQTVTEPSDEIVAGYPEGTIEVPLKPGEHYQYINGEWVHVPPTAEELRAQMRPITKRQLSLALIRNGYSLATVSAAIAAMPEGQTKDEAEIEWEYTTDFDRLNPTLVAIGDALGMTPEQIDAMWEQAKTI
ncbi:hypothetical protein M0654_19115, partial [Rhizobium sp. NTR19]|nr:hypothetical protein [Neorhizobium turbinariae]